MKILTISELSELLKVKPKTLYQWAELGQVPSIKLNGVLRFDLDDIASWVSACKKEADSRYNPFTQARGPRKGGET
jgi:excisionase family DNA binding protein